MKRLVALLCLLALTLAACTTPTPAATQGTEAPPASTAPDPAAQLEAAWEALEGQGQEGTQLPDFSVALTDGRTVTLSQLLAERELVFLNLWATWCGPCVNEFRYLQEAYTACSDRVAVLALSVEETDSFEVLRDFAAGYGLTFPMGKDEGYHLTFTFNVKAIPTSLLLDRNRTVVWMETGAMPSTQAFLDLFDAHLEGGLHLAEEAFYTVTVLDDTGAPVPGATVGFCTEESCATAVTDENGVAAFQGAPYPYHVRLLTLPEGWDYEGSDDLELKSGGDALTITARRLGR